MATKSKWKINKRFQECHDPLTPEEYKELEHQIQEEGIRDPIIIWKEQIVDGHHRDKIGTKLGIEVPFKIRPFDNEAAAIKWILRLQIGRRNLSPQKLKLAIGRLYNVEKNDQGGDRKSKAQNDTLTGETAARIAKETGTSHNTVKRDGKYAEAYSKLPSCVTKLIDEKPARATEACVLKMAGMTATELNPIARQVRVGDVARFDDIIKPKPNGKPKSKPTPPKPSVVATRVLEEAGVEVEPEQLEALAGYDSKSQVALAKNVASGAQDLDTAIETGEIVDLGSCPVCGGKKWDNDAGTGLACSKCSHPHGEPAGDIDERVKKEARTLCIKTIESAQRALDDLHVKCAGDKYQEGVDSLKVALRVAKGWKI